MAHGDIPVKNTTEGDMNLPGLSIYSAQKEGPNDLKEWKGGKW